MRESNICRSTFTRFNHLCIMINDCSRSAWIFAFLRFFQSLVFQVNVVFWETKWRFLIAIMTTIFTHGTKEKYIVSHLWTWKFCGECMCRHISSSSHPSFCVRIRRFLVLLRKCMGKREVQPTRTQDADMITCYFQHTSIRSLNRNSHPLHDP